MEIVVWLTEDYTKADSIWVEKNLSKEKITEIVNSKFDTWYYYDIKI